MYAGDVTIHKTMVIIIPGEISSSSGGIVLSIDGASV